MTKQTLYRMDSHHGVVVVLTGDAFRAFVQKMQHFDACGRSYEGINPALEPRIAAGTMTFVKPELWHDGGTHIKMIHTGTTHELDAIQRRHTIVQDVSRTFTVPFSSGDFDVYRRELEQGYGPKPTLLAELLGNIDHELVPVTGTIG